MRWRLAAVACGWVVLLLFAASVEVRGQTVTQLLDVRRDRGQSVVPVFEGWEPNEDGTFTLYFGYQNRNWKDTPDIPIGPNNFFEPGPQDRGQPTHFLPRRHKINFGVVVPKEFGEQTLVWTLSIRGRTERAVGSLEIAGGRGRYSPSFQLDKSSRPDRGNAAPALDVGPALRIVFPQPATLNATVTDDGLPKRGGGSTLTVEWRKYRGPGTVAFSDATPSVQDGKAVTTATFSEPGVYMLQALADDGSMLDGSNQSGIPGFSCCWTTATVTVTVEPAAKL